MGYKDVATGQEYTSTDQILKAYLNFELSDPKFDEVLRGFYLYAGYQFGSIELEEALRQMSAFGRSQKYGTGVPDRPREKFDPGLISVPDDGTDDDDIIDDDDIDDEVIRKDPFIRPPETETTDPTVGWGEGLTASEFWELQQQEREGRWSDVFRRYLGRSPDYPSISPYARSYALTRFPDIYTRYQIQSPINPSQTFRNYLRAGRGFGGADAVTPEEVREQLALGAGLLARSPESYEYHPELYGAEGEAPEKPEDWLRAQAVYADPSEYGRQTTQFQASIQPMLMRTAPGMRAALARVAQEPFNQFRAENPGSPWLIEAQRRGYF